VISREGTRLDGWQAIICQGRGVRIVLATDPDAVTSITARSRATVSDQGGWYEFHLPAPKAEVKGREAAAKPLALDGG